MSSSFASALGPFADALRNALPQDCFAPMEPRYREEPRGRWQAADGLLVKPATVEHVRTAICMAKDARVAVVPYGGGTGLVGGQISESQIPAMVVSLERMDKIRAVHADENVLVAEAGCILSNVHAAANAVDRMFALSLASEGSARIGGLLSTNAGGVNVLRYGNARDQVLGLEAVLPDGQIWNGLSRLRKDNTGYDLRHLLIGAEGTLGIITAASLRLAPIPATRGVAVFAVKDPAAALRLLSIARDQMGEGISAFELMHRQGMDFLAETLPDVRLPFASPPEWTVLVDVGLAHGLDPAKALEHLFEAGLDAGLVHDGLIAQSGQQADAFWAVRERMPEANRHIGAVSSHDISLPLSELPGFIPDANAALARLGDFRVNCFGHLGDGNLHYNVFPVPGKTRADHQNQRDDIKRTVHDLVHARGGSVSAEHGIGRLKVDDLRKYGDPVRMAAMASIKQALDPAGIMNPGVMFAA